VLVIAPFALAFAVASRELADRIGDGRRALVIASATLVALFLLTGAPAKRYASEHINLLSYAVGKKSHDDYARFFDVPGLTFSYYISEQMGLWVKDRTSASDTIAVRGFEPVVYIVADRRAPTRFFWTSALLAKGWAYNARTWIEEDRAALLRAPPKYVFALGTTHEGLDSAEYFEALGYVERARFGNHIALERSDTPTEPDQ
jgi:hypothetical protein